MRPRRHAYRLTPGRPPVGLSPRGRYGCPCVQRRRRPGREARVVGHAARAERRSARHRPSWSARCRARATGRRGERQRRRPGVVGSVDFEPVARGAMRISRCVGHGAVRQRNLPPAESADWVGEQDGCRDGRDGRRRQVVVRSGIGSLEQRADDTHRSGRGEAGDGGDRLLVAHQPSGGVDRRVDQHAAGGERPAGDPSPAARPLVVRPVMSGRCLRRWSGSCVRAFRSIPRCNRRPAAGCRRLQQLRPRSAWVARACFLLWRGPVTAGRRRA